jgi:hypothetical protein
MASAPLEEGLAADTGRSIGLLSLLLKFLEAVRRVREYIKTRPDILNDTSAWIDGGGWDHTSWPGAEWPTSVSFLLPWEAGLELTNPYGH